MNGGSHCEYLCVCVCLLNIAVARVHYPLAKLILTKQGRESNQIHLNMHDGGRETDLMYFDCTFVLDWCVKAASVRHLFILSFSVPHTLPEVTVKARQPLLISRGMMGECLSQPTTHTLRLLLPQRPGAHANHINTIIAPHSPPFLTENKTPIPNLSSHPLESYPPCDYHSVFVGPPCSLCHLPLP